MFLFRIDWDVFTRMTNLPTAQTNVQLYNCADEAVQNFIINTYPDFFNTSPNKLLDMLEALVTRKSNPMVHRISFSSIAQSDNETALNYVVRLRSGARDCDFICPNCHHDLSHIYIKDQFIRGIANDALAESLKTLEQNISHAEAFEMAMRDQNEISSVSDMAAYRQQRRAQDVARSTATRRCERTVAETRPDRMRVETAVVTNIVELDQVIGHGCALHGTRCAEYVASKTILRWSASRRARRNDVLCDALVMRKPPWMHSLRT